MELSEYQPLAMATAKIMEQPLDMLVHGAMGCNSESGEFAEAVANFCDGLPLDMANAMEELGDGVWFAEYTAMVTGTTLHKLMFNHPYKAEAPRALGAPLAIADVCACALRYSAAGGAIATIVKAHKFYNKDLDHHKLAGALRTYVTTILNLCAVLGMSFSDVLLANNEKLLRKRYPKGYSDAAAIARADKPEETLHAQALALVGTMDLSAAESKLEVSAVMTGQGGTFDGAGASGDWQSSAQAEKTSSSAPASVDVSSAADTSAY